MSRSEYYDDCEGWDLIRWRGAVASSIRGKRGQAFLRELLAALDAMPKKRLIVDELETADGEVCALGAVARARGLDLIGKVDPDDHEHIADRLGIADALAREIMAVNDDEWGWDRNPEERWKRVRAWVAENIREGE